MPLIFLLTKNTPQANFKITSIMNEKEFLSLKMISNILHRLNKACELSKEFVDLTSDSPLFYDSCNVIQFKRQISDLVNFLDTAAEYAKILEKD